ncbi:hypothetical protein XBKB1_430029 [Xenorhabdus bovienii str. kraussei Becker Underwood]|uniref:Uncharacterized protein n=1 Tax=Xenorhabdus bovienii str. kraussei Becker Underwood TaxID=1398204 RepID=A0A077PNG4_XENBV|nr:hypothetical protein XBKB1_430029 [Xenorhabdus bovienii str. kraussei Becker Underwood]
MADRANWDLKAHLSGNAYFDDNSLISNQAAYLQSAYNLSADNIGMQNSMSDNRTLHNSIRGCAQKSELETKG